MKRLAIRSTRDEQMDAADLDPAIYAVVLRDLSRVNRVTLNARPTLAFLNRATRGLRRFRLLDVGFGHGDMLRRISRWAAARGIEAELVGIDLNPGSAAVARAATPEALRIDFRSGDYRTLAGEGFDFVISSLVAHHMSRAEIIDFLCFMEREARVGWLVSDLHRSGLAYLGFPLLARLMRWHPIVREDGTLSIARSYRPGEWRPLLRESGLDQGAAHVVRRFPFRLCVERLR
jgi:2-polyprenyl-3-methyl-5-hydroxy-6-metoxy-1,4-benzoquinol methylase